MTSRWTTAVAALTALAALFPTSGTDATEVEVHRAASQSAFLAGELESLSVDPLGTLTLAQRVSRVASIEEPFLFTAARHPEGWVVGTGNSGRVILVRTDGGSSVLLEAGEPEIFALHVDDDGTLFAGSSPDGRVYRLRDGEIETFFEPGATYIWAITRDSRGRLLVATGTEGKLFRVEEDGSSEELFDAEDPHIRSLLPLPDGSLLVGTAGEGLVLRLSADGDVRTIHDAAAPEILSFAPAPEGGAYIAALGSEASFVELGARPSGNGNGSDDDDGDGSSEVKVSESGDLTPAGSRTKSYRGPRSQILKWTPTGSVEKVWPFQEETVFSLAVADGQLWVATGLEGKLFSLQDGKMVLEKDVEEAQIVSLLGTDGLLGGSGDGDSEDLIGTGGSPAFATTNAAALYTFEPGTEEAGSLTSSVIDAKRTAHFGSLHWEGEETAGSEVRFSFRSGMSPEPDRTWSSWTEPRTGRAIPIGDLDESRYLQWKLDMKAGEESPVVRAVEISYRQLNEKPEISSFTVMSPGQILVPGNFNAANQIYEPAHPNREGIFTTVGEPQKREGSLKTVWKTGYRTLRWKAEDPNEDELRYAISFRREEDEDGWLEMADDVENQRYSFDSTVLPDGRYRFRLTASDREANTESDSLEAQRTSELVVVDHAAPTLGQVDGGATVTVTGTDELSPLREAVYSVDARAWRETAAEDGLVDGRQETFVIAVPSDAKLLLFRLTDAAFNVTTFDLTGYLP